MSFSSLIYRSDVFPLHRQIWIEWRSKTLASYWIGALTLNTLIYSPGQNDPYPYSHLFSNQDIPLASRSTLLIFFFKMSVPCKPGC